MGRVYNFSSGPAVLPEEALQQAQGELLDWGGRGFSVMETGDRTEAFMAMMADAGSLLRELLAVPSNYRMLLQGHRAVGGMCASIYDAMPMKGVRALVDFKLDFQRSHG